LPVTYLHHVVDGKASVDKPSARSDVHGNRDTGLVHFQKEELSDQRLCALLMWAEQNVVTKRSLELQYPTSYLGDASTQEDGTFAQ
jgi:hypothetical protein